MRLREYNFLLSIRYNDDEVADPVAFDAVLKTARERLRSGQPDFPFTGGFDLLPLDMPRDQIEAGLGVSLQARQFHEGWRALTRRVVGDRPIYVVVLAGVIIASTFVIVELYKVLRLLGKAH